MSVTYFNPCLHADICHMLLLGVKMLIITLYISVLVTA